MRHGDFDNLDGKRCRVVFPDGSALEGRLQVFDLTGDIPDIYVYDRGEDHTATSFLPEEAASAEEVP